MHKTGGKIILWGLILAMLIFTATRTIHFLMLTFAADQQYIAWLGLAAFDIGVLGWMYYGMNAAEGAAQRAVAYGMIFVCMGGVIATTIADMVLVSAQNGVTKLPTQWGTLGLWAVIIVITLNVAAGVIVHLVDPKHQRHAAQEGARDKIHAATMTHISQQAELIAPQIASAVAQHWANQTIAEMAGMLPANKQPSRVVDADPVTLPQTAQIAAPSPAPSTNEKMLADLLKQIQDLRDENAKQAAKPAPVVAHHVEPTPVTRPIRTASATRRMRGFQAPVKAQEPQEDPQTAPLTQATQPSQRKTPKALPKMKK